MSYVQKLHLMLAFMLFALFFQLFIIFNQHKKMIQIYNARPKTIFITKENPCVCPTESEIISKLSTQSVLKNLLTQNQ